MFDNSEIGLWLLQSKLLPLSLKIGIVFEIFKLSRNIPFSKDRFIISAKGSAILNLMR